MTFLPTRTSFESAFRENALALSFHKTHVTVEVRETTRDRVSALLESIGYCPLISDARSDGKINFTVTPYSLPPFFQVNEELHKLLCSLDGVQAQHSETDVDEDQVDDCWKPMNNFRELVRPALDLLLSNLIGEQANGIRPIVEIGAGIGYSLPPQQKDQIIRTQMAADERFLLRKSGDECVYPLALEELYGALKAADQKVPLFFALNVFDTMACEQRLANLQRLAAVQDAGDRLLIVNDTNPHFDTVIPEIESAYPGRTALPFCYPNDGESSRFAVILLDSKSVKEKPSIPAFVNAYSDETRRNSQGLQSPLQTQLDNILKSEDPPVVFVTEFYRERMEKALVSAGYSVESAYRHAFVSGKVSDDSNTSTEELLYKGVDDRMGTVRQWPLDDPYLPDVLHEKKLVLPPVLPERKEGEKLLGAEALVFVATRSEAGIK